MFKCVVIVRCLKYFIRFIYNLCYCVYFFYFFKNVIIIIIIYLNVIKVIVCVSFWDICDIVDFIFYSNFFMFKFIVSGIF